MTKVRAGQLIGRTLADGKVFGSRQLGRHGQFESRRMRSVAIITSTHLS